MIFRATSAVAALAVALSADVAGAAECLEVPKLSVVTSADDPSIQPNAVVLRIEGPIVAPLLDHLTQALLGLDQTRDTVILHLDSPGGSLQETEGAIRQIASIRDKYRLTTFVDHGETCASACVALFIQGEARIAHGASSWLFHGACRPQTNIPSLSLTSRYLEILREGGASPRFLDDLEQTYLRKPGEYWLSGYELFHAEANIITKLLEPWEPQRPVPVPQSDAIGPH